MKHKISAEIIVTAREGLEVPKEELAVPDPATAVAEELIVENILRKEAKKNAKTTTEETEREVSDC